ncbi:histone-lysine N-methyltransferase EHMT1-like isoform X1 [Entelurus aequoreus]|uniref:histone-lysine N-methyltransferase EHMT1-like isoform X1 n=1 Tax=Entelurus aequoreus TaxID=161455 RepID=UPI002B1D6ED3|nr:histone-lysine N-methyltransferase EHMT1-like isoform X1 [Entelurus aequoreus]
MDQNGAPEGPGPKRDLAYNIGTAVGTKIRHNDRQDKATTIHLVSDPGFNCSKRLGSSSVKKLRLPGSLLPCTSGEKKVAAESMGSSRNQKPSAGVDQAVSVETTLSSPLGDEMALRKAAKLRLENTHTSAPFTTSEIEDSKGRDAIPSTKHHSVTKRKKRKMGLYNLVPKKKTKPLKKQENDCHNVQTTNATADGVIWDITKSTETSSTTKELAGEASHVEYTELNLDCLDLQAQEKLLLPHSTALADVSRSDLVEELPLCCCRMETPPSGPTLSKLDQSCMAMELTDGMLSRCHRQVMKHERMRPSNMVHLLFLCENHRTSMVKHQCCPGCGLFCNVGTFIECQPYGSISHRFHRDCASILKDRQFCPHCGEDASEAKEVTVLKNNLSSSFPTSNAISSFPAVQPVPTPQPLRAKKTSEPQRSRELNLGRDDAVYTADMRPKESMETILMGLNDENLKLTEDNSPTRQLFISSKKGALQRVIHLLVEGKDPNFLMDGQRRCSPLHAAAAGGHQEICHVLIQAGANLDIFNEDQRTPLMTACENNYLDTVKYLIRAGAAINHKDVMGFTCLHLASKLGHYDIVQHLLSRTSKYINCQDDGGWTPISWAIEHKHIEVFNLLLSKGADVNIRDKEQNVCLHWAALSGCAEVAQALLDTQCDLNASNVHGDLPIHVAARENHFECVKLFLSRGVDLHQKNKDGQTAMDCCKNGSNVWVALNTNTKLIDTRRNRDCSGEQVLNRDISRGYEAVPITCVNGVDSEPSPGNFKYLPDNCVTSPLNIDKDITHLQHCSCTDDCSSSTCLCGQLSLRCWYDSEGRLPPDFCQQDPPVLFECNHACSCWRTCKNRIVQNGLRVRLQLFKTQKMGWGVRVMQDVPQGTFICEYVGEIIPDTEANKRENDSFLFTLNNKVGDIHCIDARLFGNIGRFINHLCEPNLLAVKVFTMHQDLRFPRIAFFSNRPIKAGEQIGFDYGDHYWTVKSKYFSCKCGSLKCHYFSRR